MPRIAGPWEKRGNVKEGARDLAHVYGRAFFSYSDKFDVPVKNGSELQLGKDYLQLTIVKPNQKGEHKTPGLFLRPVLEAKLGRRNVTV
jgi:hypothetical protein